MALSPGDWLDRCRLVVCVGAGGVGKTTVAASVAMHGALRGRRAVVLTIDPARRLADSLGLSRLEGEVHRIDLSPLGEAGDRGQLWAAMLDSQGTFDRLVARLAPSEAARERIFANHVYRHMSSTFAGSQDYMAIERLHDLVEGGAFDLVVLDTPPVKNALDFLESPGRLVNFLDERILAWFLAPYDPTAARSGARTGLDAERGFGRNLLLGTSGVVFRLLGYVFGKEFLDDLAQFFQDFRGLYGGFRARHLAVERLFRAESTSFLTVCAPTDSSLEVARFFQEELRNRRLPRGGIVINQVHLCESDDHDAAAALGELVATLADLPEPVRASVLARLGMAHRRLRARALADQARVADLLANLERRYLAPGFSATIPRLEGQIHDVVGLRALGAHLFSVGGGEPVNGGGHPG